MRSDTASTPRPQRGGLCQCLANADHFNRKTSQQTHVLTVLTGTNDQLLDLKVSQKSSAMPLIIFGAFDGCTTLDEVDVTITHGR